MDRPADLPRATAIPAPDIEVRALAGSWRRLLPLWRHAVWAGLFFVVCAMSLSVRLDVAGLQKDLARNARQLHEATVLQERLRLEWSVRRRTAHIEAVALQMGLADQVPLVTVEDSP